MEPESGLGDLRIASQTEQVEVGPADDAMRGGLTDALRMRGCSGCNSWNGVQQGSGWRDAVLAMARALHGSEI